MLKKYVKELKISMRIKRTAIVSHDLQSPMSGIPGTKQYLKTNLKGLEPSQRNLLDLLNKTAV
jgi:two-component system CheB/CheR fusion protein